MTRARPVMPDPLPAARVGSMIAALHISALVPALIGACCLAAERRPGRVGELVAALVMLVAMADGMRATPSAPRILWVALLLATAITLAAARGRRRAPVGAVSRAMAVHTATGLVVTGALLALMTGAAHGGQDPHAHGLSSGALTAVLVVGALSYAAVSVVVAARSSATTARVQLVSMGASAALMAVAVIL
jgi:hypothetical protein